jgi:hypothetical protein
LIVYVGLPALREDWGMHLYSEKGINMKIPLPTKNLTHINTKAIGRG